MKYVFVLLLLYSAHGLASESEEMNLDGTLFKKSDTWFLFVENEKASFKKGTVELKDIPASQNKFLVEKAYVQVLGKQGECPSKKMCLTVKSLKPILFDPLDGRKK
jgi:hypothetical protein